MNVKGQKHSKYIDKIEDHNQLNVELVYPVF